MKRGATILNFVLIIGMLIVSMIVLLNLQKIALFQSKQVELDVSTDFVKEIRSIIENAEAYPTDLRLTITLPFAREYDMEISNGQILVYFPREDITILEPFTTSNINILPSRFSNSGKIYIYGESRNLLITNKLTCNLTDTRCDPGCIFREFNNQCDYACYSPYIRDICNPICIDTTNDGITNKDDADTICDIDCYNNYKNGGYYDVDCITSNDNICDPDTNNIIDGICDGDCKPRNGVCDPDCGTDDMDCPYIIDDEICEIEKGENCFVSIDCSCDSRYSCKVDCVEYDLDEHGCVKNSLLSKQGENCDSDCDCVSDLRCDSNHCCPQGRIWNQTQRDCVREVPILPVNKFRLVVVPVNFNFPSDRVEYEQLAKQFFDRFIQESPFRECSDPNQVAELLLLENDCSAAASDCYGVDPVQGPRMCLSSCVYSIFTCANSEDINYDKAEAIYHGTMNAIIPSLGQVIGCAPLANLETPDSYFSGSYYGGAIHEYPLGNQDLGGNLHELGHDFGLCHPKCPGGCTRPDPPAQCPNNDRCDTNDCTTSRYIMAYGTKEFFAPQSYNHLKNHIYLKDYLEGCVT